MTMPGPSTAAGRQTTCLVCGSTELDALGGYERFDLVCCLACTFVFVARIPSPEELDAHYTGIYQQREEALEWLSPVTAGRFEEWLDMMAPYRRTARILDVGCGVGQFLVQAAGRGWEAYGTEYPENAVEICRRHGITMAGGPLRPENYEPESFDVVTSLGVIEHIYDPADEVDRFHAVLRPGGLLWITTPNWSSLSRRLLRDRSYLIEVPGHLGYFAPRTLTRLLESRGFHPLNVETTGFSPTRFRCSLAGQRLTHLNEETGDEKVRAALENRPALKAVKGLINTGLTVSRLGDEMKAAFVRL